MRWFELLLLLGELFLLFLSIFGVIEGILKGCEGTVSTASSHKLEGCDLSGSEEVIAPRLVRQPAGALCATRGFLRLAPVVDALLDILDIVDKLGSAALVSLELVLQAKASRGTDMLGEAVLRLSNLGVGFSETSELGNPQMRV